MVNAIDERFAAGRQTGEHESRGGAQVGRHNRCRCQLVDAAAYCHVAFNSNVSTHALQFQYVLKAIFEYCFGDCADAFRDRVQGAKLRLHISWESRVR